MPTGARPSMFKPRLAQMFCATCGATFSACASANEACRVVRLVRRMVIWQFSSVVQSLRLATSSAI
jgi:hypothetical protein